MKPNAEKGTTAPPTHQLSTWLHETRREGAYFAGQKISERQSALLQELDETLTQYEGGKQA
jgi:hypothetical protein